MAVHGVEACELSSKEEVQVPAIYEKGIAHRFWGYARPNHHFIVKKGNFVNSANYYEQLKQVKRDIKNRRRDHQSKGVILHHDDARPHIAAQSVQTINNLDWKLLSHPTYIPDRVHSDFHLSCPLKEFTRGSGVRTGGLRVNPPFGDGTGNEDLSFYFNDPLLLLAEIANIPFLFNSPV